MVTRINLFRTGSDNLRSKRPDAQALVFLGTGGADCTPRVGCLCDLCSEARQKKGRYSRNGRSVFFTGVNVVFGSPEDISPSIESVGINSVVLLFTFYWNTA